ncbi:hypothetical protein HanPI659440_Chr15g0615521 [Helianthus annuus]|nr:hypothetical protein HanPI659440_Chr15g0615521 [Helianthus annuus]
MAIQTPDNQSESNLHKSQQNTPQNHDADAVSNQIETLKSLNTLLLKETKENRQHVESLTQSNSCLESELTQSVMANESLKSEMNSLSEQAVRLEIERGLIVVFMTVQVNQVEDVKREIERLMREKELEIRGLNKRLDELLVEMDEQRGVSARVSEERDAVKARLDERIREVNELLVKVKKVEESEARVLEEVDELKMECDRLMVENTESARRVELVTKEKDEVRTSLIEANGVVDELRRDVAKLIEEKTVIVDEKVMLDGKNSELQTSVDELKKLVESMRIEEGALLEKLAVLEKKYAASSKNEEEMTNKINELVEEKKETETRIERLDNDKSLVAKDLEDAMKELQQQKLSFEQIVKEKTELENSKIERESEIVKKDEQLSAFKDMISSLEMSSANQVEKIKELEVEAGSYKLSFDQAALERDEVLKQLDEQKAVTDDFKQTITGMEKEMEDLHEKLATLTAENGEYLGEKNRLKDRCAGLVKEVADLEARFAESRTEFDRKLKAAEANSKRVLNILKKTVLVCDGNDDFDQENGVEDGIKEHVAGIETIKKAFKDNKSILAEMKMQLELVKTSAEKEKGFWTMVSSATTLLAAAVSLAYVARAR